MVTTMFVPTASAARPRVPRRAADLVEGAQLRPLVAKRDLPGALLGLAHLVLIVALGLGVYWLRHSWWSLPVMSAEGVAIAHLFALQHETAHNTAFTSTRVNRSVSVTCGALLCIAPALFRVEHGAHHRFTQEPGRDPELIPAPASVAKWVWFVIGGPFWVYQATTLATHARGRIPADEQVWIPDSARAKVIREARWMLVLWAAALIVPLVLGTDLVLLCWILPRFLGEPSMRLARLSEHAGLELSQDITVNTRSLAVPLPLRLLAWNMPLHAEHHAMPSVPFHRLPALAALLGTELRPVDGGYLRAQADLLAAARRR